MPRPTKLSNLLMVFSLHERANEIRIGAGYIYSYDKKYKLSVFMLKLSHELKQKHFIYTATYF